MLELLAGYLVVAVSAALGCAAVGALGGIVARLFSSKS